MNLQEFNFKEIVEKEGISPFTDLPTNKELLEEAKKRGHYDYYDKYNKLANIFFFDGGQLHFKEGLDEDFRKYCTQYYRLFIQSFAPKHEEKSAICGMLLSELVDIKKYNIK